MQPREQRQGANYGNGDSDDSVAGVGGKRIAVHTYLLADGSVVHEIEGIAFRERCRAVFGQCWLFTGE